MQALDKLIDKLGPSESSDRYQGISASEFKRSPPKIRDDNPDLDAYDLQFDNMIQCLSVGKQRVSDYNRLMWYCSGFLDGSTRKKVYDNAIRKAIRKDRLPKESGEVLKEIQAELRTYIWETKMQKMTRLDK